MRFDLSFDITQDEATDAAWARTVMDPCGTDMDVIAGEAFDDGWMDGKEMIRATDRREVGRCAHRDRGGDGRLMCVITGRRVAAWDRYL